jgi:hypothetical protein
MTLLFLGIPGLLLSLIVRLTLREPKRGASEHEDIDKASYNVRDTLTYLWTARSFQYLTLGTTLNVFSSWAVLVWSPSFLLRVHDMPTDVSGPWLGLAAGLSGIVGTLASGFVTQRLAKTDERWLMWVPALSNLLTIPFVVLFLMMPSATGALPMFFGIMLFGPALIGPVSTVIQGIAKVRMRAFAPALVSIFFNFAGVGLGPLTAGILSDLLAKQLGAQSIRYALLIAALAPLVAALAFAAGTPYLRADLERTRQFSRV